MPYDIDSLAYGYTTEQAHILSLPLKYPICKFEREATFYENYYQKIDFWWRVGQKLISTDAKADRRLNRTDDTRSNEISTAEFLGITGHVGSILGKADHMDMRRGTSFKMFKKQTLVDLCHARQHNDPLEKVEKTPRRSIPHNWFYYRSEHPEELLFNFLWSEALQLPHHSYDIPEEFLALEDRFLDFIKSQPKYIWKLNDYRHDINLIKKFWSQHVYHV